MVYGDSADGRTCAESMRPELVRQRLDVRRGRLKVLCDEQQPGPGRITAIGHLTNHGGLPPGALHDDGTESLPICAVAVGVKQEMKTAGSAVEVVEAQRLDRARRAEGHPPQGRERQIGLS